MSNKDTRFRVLASFANSKARMVRWSGMMYIKSEMQGNKETLDHVNFLKRNSLFFDSEITYDDIEVSYVLRVGDQALCLNGNILELRTYDDSGLPLKGDKPAPVPGAEQVVLDPTQALYIRTFSSIHKVFLANTFNDKQIDVHTINEETDVMSARGGMLAYLKMRGENLFLRKYSPEGYMVTTKEYILNYAQVYHDSYRDTEPKAVKPRPMYKAKMNRRESHIDVVDANMSIAGSGVLVAIKFKEEMKYTAILFYYRLMSNGRNHLIDSKDITPKDCSIEKHNMRKRCTLFEQRGMPAALIWHPKIPTSYALFVFKNGRLMTMVDWGKDQFFLNNLKGNFTMSVPRTEYDYITNKLLLCTVKHNNEKNKHAVFVRVRFTF